MPYVVDPSNPLQPTNDKGATQGAEELRNLKGFVIAKSFVSITAKPYSAVADCTRGTVASGTDVSANIQDAIDDVNAQGGGVVFAPRVQLGKAYRINEVFTRTGIHLMGELAAPVYDHTVVPYEGTVFYSDAGDYAIRMPDRYSKISNFCLDCQNGTTEYGVIWNNINGIDENVSISNVPYGRLCSGMNGNQFIDMGARSCSKAAMVISNAQEVTANFGLIQYPLVAALISDINNSKVYIKGGQFKNNNCGLIVRSVGLLDIRNLTIETSLQYAMVIFKANSGNCDQIYAKYLHIEGNWGIGAADIAGIEALRTAAAGVNGQLADKYLEGSISGIWNAGTDGYYDFLIGGSDDDYRNGNLADGPPTAITFEECYLLHNYGGFRIKSARRPKIKGGMFTSGHAATLINADAVNCYGLDIIDVEADTHADEIWGYKAAGNQTSIVFSTPEEHKIVAMPNNTYTDIVDFDLLSKFNQYKIAISIQNDFATYGATVEVFHDGTTLFKFPGTQYAAAGAGLQWVGNKLQYRQVSGGASDVYWKIFNKGRFAYSG